MSLMSEDVLNFSWTAGPLEASASFDLMIPGY